jgi:hypothetical protein
MKTLGCLCALLIVASCAIGCAETNSSGNQKREQDRQAMRIDQLTRERDDARAEVERLRRELAAARGSTTMPMR